MRKLTLILVTLLLAVSFMTAQEIKGKPTVVIIPFETKNINEDEEEILFEVFTNELASTGKVKVVDRSQVDKIKAQHNFQNSEWSDSNKVAQLGKALNANMVVTGKIMSNEKDLVAILRMLDVNTMEIVAPATARVSDISNFYDKIPEVVKILIGESKEISMLSNISTSETKDISTNTEVSMTQIEVTESPKDENSNTQENESQNIDFSFPDKQTVSESFSEKELKDAKNRYWGNISAGSLVLTFGLISSVAGLTLTIVGFVQHDYYNQTPSLDDYKDYRGRYDYDSYNDDCDYYSDKANEYLAMGIIGVVPLLTGGLLMIFLSAIPFSTASKIDKKYFSVSSTGGYGNKNERLEIAFGYRF